MSFHFCAVSKFKSENFKCNKANYFECIKDKPGISNLLFALGMIGIKGKVITSKPNLHGTYMALKLCFSADSMVQLICDSCRSKVPIEKAQHIQLINDLSVTQKQLREERSKNIRLEQI